MKFKYLLFFLLLLVSLVNTSAGETYKLDFEKNPSYTMDLIEGDRVEYFLNNSIHTTLIKTIDPSKVELATFTYTDINRNNPPFYTTITSKKYMKLDVNRDSEDDLYIMYQKSNSTTASLKFQLPLSTDKNLEIFPENRFKDNTITYLLYALILVLIVIIFLAIINYKIKSKEKKEPEKEEKQDKNT